jgi:hypothetical protein
MILPAGVNKATGLRLALEDLKLSPHNAIGVGDAENDHAFLQICEFSVAVANALPAIKGRVDLVTEGRAGAGVTELANLILRDDLASIPPPSRLEIRLGADASGTSIGFQPYGPNLLFAGKTGAGDNTIVRRVIDQLVDRVYQFCLLNLGRDREAVGDAIELGSADRAPDPAEIAKILEQQPKQNVLSHLSGISSDQRPAWFARFHAMLQELQARYGRPHQVIVDQAEEIFPADTKLPGMEPIPGTILVASDPRRIHRSVLNSIDVIVATGRDANRTLADFCDAVGTAAPANTVVQDDRHAIVWFVKSDRAPIVIEIDSAPRERHAAAHA